MCRCRTDHHRWRPDANWNWIASIDVLRDGRYARCRQKPLVAFVAIGSLRLIEKMSHAVQAFILKTNRSKSDWRTLTQGTSMEVLLNPVCAARLSPQFN